MKYTLPLAILPLLLTLTPTILATPIPPWFDNSYWETHNPATGATLPDPGPKECDKSVSAELCAAHTTTENWLKADKHEH